MSDEIDLHGELCSTGEEANKRIALHENAKRAMEIGSIQLLWDCYVDTVRERTRTCSAFMRVFKLHPVSSPEDQSGLATVERIATGAIGLARLVLEAHSVAIDKAVRDNDDPKEPKP